MGRINYLLPASNTAWLLFRQLLVIPQELTDWIAKVRNSNSDSDRHL